MSPTQLAAIIDHTLLKPEASIAQVDQLCAEAVEHSFCAVCVNAIHVARAARRLAGSNVRIASVAGFPLGAVMTATKVDDARRAVEAGAFEIDMVLNIGGLLSGEKNLVRDDIAAVADAVHSVSVHHIIKVILETAVLTPEQIALGCRCCAEAQVDFVKTSTGFHPAGGATIEAVRALKRYAAPIKVKASGGIRDLQTALAMVDAGADRLGLSSGVSIIREARRSGLGTNVPQ